MPKNLWHIRPVYATMFVAMPGDGGYGRKRLERSESETEASRLKLCSAWPVTHYKEHGQMPADAELE